MQHDNWACEKCGNREFETNQMRAEGGVLSAMFDVSTNRFTVLSCTRCGYCELYRLRRDGLEQALDFIVG